MALYASGNKVRLDKYLNSQAINGTPRWGISGVSIGDYGLAAHGGTYTGQSNSLRRYGVSQVTAFNLALTQTNFNAGTATNNQAAAANSGFAFIGGGRPATSGTSGPISTVTTINPALTVGSVTGLQSAACGLSAASLNNSLVFFFGGSTADATTPYNYKTTVYDPAGTRNIGAADLATGISNIGLGSPCNFGFSIGTTYAGIARQYGAEVYNASLTKSQINLSSNPSAECMSTKSYGIIPMSESSAVAIDESLTVHNLGYGFPMGNACCKVKDVAVSLGGGPMSFGYSTPYYSKAAYKVDNRLVRTPLTSLNDFHGGNPGVANVADKFVVCYGGAESGVGSDDSDTGYFNLSSKYDVYKA